MPIAITPAFVALLLLNLIFAYLSGISDSANIVAPVISARAIRPRLAVARSFGTGVLQPAIISPVTVLAATLSAVVWRWLTTWWGVPASSSHGVIGGMLGAGLAAGGLAAVNLEGLVRVLLALFISPVLGLAAGYVLCALLYRLAEQATPRINGFFRFSQVFTALALALSYGANDGQKTIGLLALGVAAATGTPFEIPDRKSVV